MVLNEGIRTNTKIAYGRERRHSDKHRKQLMVANEGIRTNT